MESNSRRKEQISQYRFRLAGNSKETDLRNSKIKTEKDIIYSQYMELKSQMNAMREKERENLTKLSVESKDCKFELERKIQKAEQILKLGEMARRLETEEEKVLPFFASSLTQDEQKDINEAYAEEPSEDLAKENQKLRLILKQYLDGISVNDEILSHVNPLFIVNQKSNVNLAAGSVNRLRSSNPVVIEAAIASKHLTN